MALHNAYYFLWFLSDAQCLSWFLLLLNNLLVESVISRFSSNLYTFLTIKQFKIVVEYIFKSIKSKLQLLC